MDLPDGYPCVFRVVEGHHIFTGLTMEITIGKPFSVKDFQKVFFMFVGFVSFNLFSEILYCGRHIFRTFHSSFNLQGINTGIQNLIHVVYGCDILRTHKVGLCSGSTLPIQKVIREPAGLGTSSAVSASAA